MSKDPFSNGTECYLSTSVYAGVTTVTIQNPVVNRASFPYESVLFKPGDEVTVKAGGCVQTGGFGLTWKRYVNPSGSDSGSKEGLYHGTITIPGGRAPNGQLVLNWPISDAIAAGTIVVQAPASGPSVPAYLTLGYRDDNYGDNGYSEHDDGDNGQCASGTDGGNAHVALTITPHSGTTPPPPAPVPVVKAFDLVPTEYDFNWAMTNPAWGWQIPGTVRSGPPFGHFTADCGQAPLSPAPPSCTNQNTTVNPSPEPSLFSTSPWRSIKDFFELCHYGQGHTGGPFGAHINWGEATYTDSTVEWKSWDPPTWGDDDYSLKLHTPRLATGGMSGVAPEEDQFIETEFDSDETVDHYDPVPWWRQLHLAAWETTFSPLRGKGYRWMEDHLDGHEAVVMGTIGLDAAHGIDAGAEMHPVHVLAVREASPGQVDSGNDAWAFFVRNSGNEGECSSYQEYLDAEKIVLRLPPPPGVEVEGGEVLSQGKDIIASNTTAAPTEYPDSTGMYLTFELPPAQEQGFVAGEVHVKWKLRPGFVLAPHPRSVARPRRSATRESLEPNSPEATLAQDYRRLSRTGRAVYRALVLRWRTNRVAPHVRHLDLVRVAHAPQRGAQAPLLVQAFDPLHVANVASRLYALAIASKGRIVPLPKLPSRHCTDLAKTLAPPLVMATPGATAEAGSARELTIARSKVAKRLICSRWHAPCGCRAAHRAKATRRELRTATVLASLSLAVRRLLAF